jgi:hypothetical protein
MGRGQRGGSDGVCHPAILTGCRLQIQQAFRVGTPEIGDCQKRIMVLHWAQI